MYNAERNFNAASKVTSFIFERSAEYTMRDLNTGTVNGPCNTTLVRVKQATALDQ